MIQTRIKFIRIKFDFRFLLFFLCVEFNKRFLWIDRRKFFWHLIIKYLNIIIRDLRNLFNFLLNFLLFLSASNSLERYDIHLLNFLRYNWLIGGFYNSFNRLFFYYFDLLFLNFIILVLIRTYCNRFDSLSKISSSNNSFILKFFLRTISLGKSISRWTNSFNIPRKCSRSWSIPIFATMRSEISLRLWWTVWLLLLLILILIRIHQVKQIWVARI